MLLVSGRSCSSATRRRASLLALAFLCTSSVLAGQGTKLNGPLALGVAGDVTESQISPDSKRVVYRADQSVDEVFRLYGVAIEGGAVVPIGPAPVTGGDVQNFAISPSSRFVVYRADQDTDEVFELYSASIAGRQPGTRLNGTLVPGGDVASFQIGSDSRRVVYLANQESSARLELFSVPLTGGAPVKLNGALAAGGNVGQYLITPDGKRVAYAADQRADELHELFVVAIDGGTPQVLGLPFDSRRSFVISPDSRRVVFLANELYSVSILGGQASLLSSFPQFSNGYSITPDSRHVLCLGPGDLGRAQLYSVPTEGGPAKKLTEHGDSRVAQVVISPDSRLAAYSLRASESVHSVFIVPVDGGEVTPIREGAGQIYVGPFSSDSKHLLYNELIEEFAYSAPTSGGAAVQLGEEYLYASAITPDSKRVLCLDWQTFGNVYSIPVTGGTLLRLNDTPVPNGGVATASLSPDGARVVYRADQDSDDVFELYSVSVHGGPVTKLNAPLVLGGIAGDVGRYLVSPDGTRLVYEADQDVDQVYELFSVRLPDGPPTKLNDPFGRGGEGVGGDPFTISPDSRRVVYTAHEEINGRRELYSVPIDGGPVVKLSTQGVVSWDVRISPDSSWVVFRDDVAPPAFTGIRAVPIDGGAPVVLNATLQAGYGTGLQISPDSSRVLFSYTEAGVFRYELYGVPITGGVPTKLNPTPVPSGNVQSWQVLPDSNTVIYMADLEVDELLELYSVPIGGGPTTKLNGPLVAGGDVFHGILAASDSSHIVYRADQDTDQVVELYSVSLPGLARVKLNPPLVAGRGVVKAAVAPDASRVVYVADQNANDVFELFSVPIGGGPTTRLNAPLVAGGDVDTASFFVGPRSDRVVYFADQDRNNVLELYSVPLGGGPVAKVSGQLAPGGDVLTSYLQFDELPGRVLFLADRAGNDVYELFVGPLTGGPQPELLNAPLVPSGDVGGFQLARGSVVYGADQDEDEVFELYLSSLPRPALARAR